MEDKRFAHVATDPKFRSIPKGERKVKIDKRFRSMFSDKRFKVKYTTDKRGRPVSHTSTEDLKRYYDLSSEEEVEDGSSEVDEAEPVGKYVTAPKSESGSEDEQNQLEVKYKTDRQISDGIRNKLKDLKVDYARGDGNLYSESSSSDEESQEEESESDEVDHKWGELDADADRTEETTFRLAACNMDWDRIRAVDLMVLFSSFLPQSGMIKSVVIYPSEFGLQRMQEEEVKGPIELVECKAEDSKEKEEETEEGSKYHMEKLREYQLNRLKYYYALITCDSVATANKIYAECDGLEYESSATKIDLRFVPDDMSFDARPKESCEQLPDMAKYRPRFFTTTALQQAKVDLTWDETNPERIEITQKLSSGKIDDISEGDLQAYLASSSDEDEEKVGDDEEEKPDLEDDGGNAIDKYRALLNEIEENENEKEKQDVQMEVSWNINLKEQTEKLVRKKLSEQEDKTPFQQYLDKRKEKRKQKRESRKNHSDADSDVPSDLDLNDSYFAEEFDRPEFKQKRKPAKLECEEDKQKEAELELLLLNDDEAVDGKEHFDLKKIQEQENESKSRRRKQKIARDKAGRTDDFEVKVNDERFSALFTSHHFNIDPTDPHFKKTRGMERLMGEKLKRRNAEEEDGGEAKRTKRRDAELSVLVKSVKRKVDACVGNKNTK